METLYFPRILKHFSANCLNARLQTQPLSIASQRAKDRSQLKVARPGGPLQLAHHHIPRGAGGSSPTGQRDRGQAAMPSRGRGLDLLFRAPVRRRTELCGRGRDPGCVPASTRGVSPESPPNFAVTRLRFPIPDRRSFASSAAITQEPRVFGERVFCCCDIKRLAIFLQTKEPIGPEIFLCKFQQVRFDTNSKLN